MRVREVHAEVERLFGEAVPFSSVAEALWTHARGEDAPFARVRYGVYALSAKRSVSDGPAGAPHAASSR